MCIRDSLKVVRQRMFDLNFRERFDLESTMGIYDEIAGTTPIGKAKDYILALADVMRIQAPGFEVPLDVEASVGFTWGTQIEIGLPTPENIDRAMAEPVSYTHLDRLAELRAASAERREQAELALRTALAEHPGDERQAQQAATTLLAEYWAVEQFKYVDDPAAGQES